MNAAYLMVLIASLCIVLVAFSRPWRRRSEAGRSLLDTLSACRTLLTLTGHFQQHRGMSSAWLSGDRSFVDKLAGKASEIEVLLDSLRPIALSENARPHPCITPNDLKLFRFKWGQLREKLSDLSVEQSIAQHTYLIDQLLQWLGAIGEARLEPMVAGRCSRTIVRNFVTRLPALTECLGQARAVGMTVAARQGCSAVARVRLMFLIARAEALMSQAADGQDLGHGASTAVPHMARLVRSQMLLSSGVNVGVQEYFDVATRAIDSVFVWISETGDQLAQLELSGRSQGALAGAHGH